MLSTRSRTGSERALNPLASLAASEVPRGAPSTEALQPSVRRVFTVDVVLVTSHLTH